MHIRIHMSTHFGGKMIILSKLCMHVYIGADALP